MSAAVKANIWTPAPEFQNFAGFFDEILTDPVSQLHRAGLYLGAVVFDDAVTADEVAL